MERSVLPPGQRNIEDRVVLDKNEGVVKIN